MDFNSLFINKSKLCIVNTRLAVETISKNYNTMKFDKTKWYTINYDMEVCRWLS